MPKKSKFRRDWSKSNKAMNDRKKKFKNDERIYTLKYNDSTNSAKVVMRFLPPINDDFDVPYSEQHKHWFSDSGGWIVEPCPQTLGKACPICDDIKKTDLYNKDEDLWKDRKKKISFYTNALIIEDEMTPANVGKVFIMKFGNKIMDMADEAREEDQQPWDEEAGVNFTWKAKKKKNSNMPDYGTSKFSEIETSLSDYGDEDEILAMRHDLSEFEDEDSFKDYDELKKRYLDVIGEGSDDDDEPKSRRTRTVVEDNDTDNDGDNTDSGDSLDDGDDVGDETMFDDSGDDDDFFDDLVTGDED